MSTLKPTLGRSRRNAGVGPADFKAIRLFAGVAEDRIQELARSAWQEHISARAVVIEEDAPSEALYGLLEGSVEVLSGLDAQETVIDVVEPGSALLLACAVTAIPYIASVRTLSPVRLVAVPTSAVRELFDDDKAFARSVAAELSRSSCRMILDLKSLKVRTSIERLADWLIEAAGSAENGNREIRLPFGKRILASRLGMTPECLSRSLRALAAHGVRVRGREVILTDRAALARFAGTHEGDDEAPAPPRAPTQKLRKPQITAAS